MTTNYNPYRALNELQQQMQRLWNESANAQKSETTERWSPVVDICESENELVLQSELPGMQQSDFKLSVENYVLTLSGQRQPAEPAKPIKTQRQERLMGAFQRSFSLPANVDVGKVNAD